VWQLLCSRKDSLVPMSSQSVSFLWALNISVSCSEPHSAFHAPEPRQVQFVTFIFSGIESKKDPLLMCCSFCPQLKASVVVSRCVCVCFSTRQEMGAPFPEALQYRVDAWSERGKPLFQLPVLKIHLIYSPRIGDVSDIKLIRTDTTLDLSQKAEKR